MRQGDDDDIGDPESAESWFPDAQTPLSLEVDWSPPEVTGALWLPDDSGGFELTEYTDDRVFGFARFLEEKGD